MKNVTGCVFWEWPSFQNVLILYSVLLSSDEWMTSHRVHRGQYTTQTLLWNDRSSEHFRQLWSFLDQFMFPTSIFRLNNEALYTLLSAVNHKIRGSMWMNHVPLIVCSCVFLDLCRCDATSPYIHPIGWCQENNRTLTTPPGESLFPPLFPSPELQFKGDLLCRQSPQK